MQNKRAGPFSPCRGVGAWRGGGQCGEAKCAGPEVLHPEVKAGRRRRGGRGAGQRFRKSARRGSFLHAGGQGRRGGHGNGAGRGARPIGIVARESLIFRMLCSAWSAVATPRRRHHVGPQPSEYVVRAERVPERFFDRKPPNTYMKEALMLYPGGGGPTWKLIEACAKMAMECDGAD